MRYVKKTIARHIIIKLNKTSDEEQILKVPGEKGHYVQR